MIAPVTAAPTGLDIGRLGLELAVVVTVGLILNSIGVMTWGEYTVIFVLAILLLNPTETLAFADSISGLIAPTQQAPT